MDFSKIISRQNVESVNWLIFFDYDKMWEEKDELEEELFRLQAEFKGYREEPEHAELDNKIISHFPSLKAVKDFQSMKQAQDKDQIKVTLQAHLLISLKDFRK